MELTRTQRAGRIGMLLSFGVFSALLGTGLLLRVVGDEKTSGVRHARELMQAGRNKEAAEELAQAHAINPGDGSIRALLISALQSTGDREGAARVMAEPQ